MKAIFSFSPILQLSVVAAYLENKQAAKYWNALAIYVSYAKFKAAGFLVVLP